MKQKPWDRYEAALLLSYCLKIEAGDIPRKEAVDIVSNTLRKRAEVQGVEIDETFRNTNGISMQMSAIRNCYLGSYSTRWLIYTKATTMHLNKSYRGNLTK